MKWVHVNDTERKTTLIFCTDHVAFIVQPHDVEAGVQINFKCGNTVVVSDHIWQNINKLFDGHDAVKETYHGKH